LHHLILWNTAADTFEHGAWFRGRLYEERCDLSPDGKLFLYFALQGRKWGTTYKGAWTAVSRAPWLEAIVLWPQGHTWGGGGRFVDVRKIVLSSCSTATHPDHPLMGLEVVEGHAPLQASSGDVEGAEWSGRDHSGTCLYARDGRLFRRGPRTDREVADLRGLIPDPQPAPVGAGWPLPPLRRTKRR
jgi:hypothetical protein